MVVVQIIKNLKCKKKKEKRCNQKIIGSEAKRRAM
jgi:hypothetical protein